MKKLKKYLSLILAGILVTGMLTACGKGETEVATAGGDTSGTAGTTDTKDTAATTDTTDGGVQELNLRASSFGNNYDVQDMGWRWMMAECYEGLLRDVGGPDGDKFELAGAESIDVSEDGLTYTFHLRQNAKWSDGKPVTANDYKYGWDRLIDPEKGYSYAAFIFNVVGAEEYYNGTGSLEDVAITAKDDYTFLVKLKVADPTFESKLVATPLYPTRKDIAEAAGDNWGKDWRLSVYNGPYVLSELVEDNKMTWTKNDYYWDAANVKLNKVNWFDVAEDATAATMFDNGQLDVIDGSGDYIKKYDEEAKAGKIQTLATQYPGTAVLSYEFKNGGKSGLMNNVNIRKAISYSINREEMVGAVYGRYSPAYGLISPAITFNGESYRSQAAEPISAEYKEYAGDKDKLQALFQKGLDEVGVKTPLKDVSIVLLTYGSSTQNQTEREYLKQSLEQNLGIKVELNTVGDSSLFTSERDAFNFDIMISAWYSDYNDPLDYLDIFRTGIYHSYGLYTNKDYDALLDSLTGLKDNAKRFEIYQKLENKLLVEDCGAAPLYYADKHYYIQNWVKDFHTSSFGASQEVYKTSISGK
ncbi:peptide ABC transporter substrate-binding protein [Anaerocolumna sp. AGMB13025]|uniref:peptide ABC transporter substrate-binding protein n=1 Tax=Anaerocolumna sp. AGMB13025 TaxID=3039116 RepID=UPI00241E7C80|nr:peptide ABC transporter substrate-binding protein [Anaerocolumna sp. AGMB13025]WFR57714.1 peptide ABC transporter substrate-binding protein [Anaerocolumna sp. AGMB13025]